MVENAGEGVAERGPTAMADVQRTNGVSGDVLDLDALTSTEVRAAKVLALLAHGAEDLVTGGDGKVDVHEARASDLDAIDLRSLGEVGGDGLGDRAGRHVGDLGAAEGDGARPIAVRGIRGTLEAEVCHLELRQFACRLCLGQCSPDQLLDRLDHDASFQRARGPKAGPRINISCRKAAMSVAKASLGNVTRREVLDATCQAAS